MDETAVTGKKVRVIVDRKMHTAHPEHPDIIYGVNYGYIIGEIGGDGEEQDAYVLGVDEPVEVFEGEVIAVIQRLNDNETKWIVSSENVNFSDEEIIRLTRFQEKYFKIRIVRQN